MGVFVHTLIIIMPELNVGRLQSTLLMTPLSELSHNIIIPLQVWCNLKFVTTMYVYSGLIV